MLRRILTLMRQDWTNALRDNILLYIMVGPLLLALAARFFLPSLDQAQYTFAVQQGLDPVLVQRLESLGRVEQYPDAAAVRARVARPDDVPGLLLEGRAPVLLFEGNEGGEALALRGVVAHALQGERMATFTHTSRGAARSLLTEYAAIIFVMLGTLLGALVMAFNIIEDKETRAGRALGVSPLSMLELTVARGLFALVLGLVIVLATTWLLMGTHVDYGLLLTGILLSMGLPVLTGYVIGGLADNQLKAIAILKFYMLVYLSLPIITVFLPQSWRPLFYILPNYWMWHTMENVFIGNVGGPGFWLSGLITLVLSLALVVALLPLLRRELALR
jgi:ABC-2 type transport system permease protein